MSGSSADGGARARWIALALAPASAILDAQRPDRERRLPGHTVAGAMERYLAQFGPDAWRVRDLLLPLAWAEGAGLADPEVWAAPATGLGTDRYTAQDVA